MNFMIRNYLSDHSDEVLQIYVVEFDLQVCETRLSDKVKVSPKGKLGLV